MDTAEDKTIIELKGPEELLKPKCSVKKSEETLMHTIQELGFPGGSVGKESTCNAGNTGDMAWIPGLERYLP